MTTTDVDVDQEEGQVRPFADFLQELNAGTSHAELSAALKELVGAVQMIGKVGSITYTIKIKPAGRNAESTVLITDNLKVTLPEGDRSESVFFIDRDGNPSRHNPDQMRLPLREAPGGKVVNTDTGEVKDHA